jgi:biopolymer transport protein ExbD
MLVLLIIFIVTAPMPPGHQWRSQGRAEGLRQRQDPLIV